VVARAQQLGVARLALKALAYSKLPSPEGPRPFAKCWYQPVSDPRLASLALRFALSQPITAALPPGEAELFRLAVDIARDYAPITDDEVAQLRLQAADAEPFFTL
jgi:hypothetical protein